MKKRWMMSSVMVHNGLGMILAEYQYACEFECFLPRDEKCSHFIRKLERRTPCMHTDTCQQGCAMCQEVPFSV